MPFIDGEYWREIRLERAEPIKKLKTEGERGKREQAEEEGGGVGNASWSRVTSVRHFDHRIPISKKKGSRLTEEDAQDSACVLFS